MTEQDLYNQLMAAYFPGQRLNALTEPQFSLVQDLVGYFFDAAGDPVDADAFLDYVGVER